MAEAVVEERTHIPTRFYCHMCDREFTLNNSDYTCPICATGFIEEVPAQSPAQLPTSTNTALLSANGQSGSTRNPGEPGQRANDFEVIRDEITSLLMSRNMTPNASGNLSLESPQHRSIIVTNATGNSNGSTGGGGGGSRVRRRPLNFDRVDTVLFEFLQQLSGDVIGPLGNSQMFFMGNPGDYAWGREGIDTIVTQLLNQMETSGPPPLAKDKIREIPHVEITDEEINNKLQCSVCWEDFRLNETVRKLPCMHIYHENCIVPWLDLHGTCPICRKSLIMDGEDAAMTDVSCPLHNSASASTSGSHTTSSVALLHNPSTSTEAQLQQQQPSTSSTSQSNNVFAFDDGNVDYDFD